MLAPLSWGIQPPETAIAAWGARGIASGRYGDQIDLLPDRQSARGDHAEWAALEARLNGEDSRAYLPGKGALFQARHAWAKGYAFRDRYAGTVATLYADPECQVVGCWRGGYVMLGAWLSQMPEPESPEAQRLRILRGLAVSAEPCPKNLAHVQSQLTRYYNAAVRFGSDALVMHEARGVIHLRAEGYIPVPRPKRPRMPAPPRHRTHDNLRQHREQVEHLEREFNTACTDATRSDAAAWYAAKVCILGEYPREDVRKAFRAMRAR